MPWSEMRNTAELADVLLDWPVSFYLDSVTEEGGDKSSGPAEQISDLHDPSERSTGYVLTLQQTQSLCKKT